MLSLFPKKSQSWYDMLRKLIIFICFFSFLSCSVSSGIQKIQNKPDMEKLNLGVQIGSPVFEPEIKYPNSEWKRGREGWVLFNTNIGPDGKPYGYSVSDFFPSENFIEPAMEYMEKVKYRPYIKQGSPVHVTDYYILVLFEIEFEE